ncbi:MAG: hypothetical protein R3Y63_14890 [Eubacteriales bacterium]
MAELVYKAFLNSSIYLNKIGIFHTDHGSEFKNKTIDELLAAFQTKKKRVSLRQRCSRSYL